MSSNSKKWAASIAALEILLYHCWIPVFGYGTVPGSVERFLIASTYAGVDIFFFISAYSLVSRPVEDYQSFLINRAVKLLPLFLIALLTGRFLWFIPSIMVMYLVLPPLYRLCRKKPVRSFFILLIGWAGLVYLVLGLIRPAQDFGIFLFRIPSMILGAYAVGFRKKLSPRGTLITGVLLLAVGILLVYKFGYMRRLNVPYRGTFYLTGIPVMLGTVLLTDRFASGRESRLIERFGSMTLELYFTQMVLGTFLTGLFFRLTDSRLVTDLAVIAVVILISALIKMLNDAVTERLWVGKTAG